MSVEYVQVAETEGEGEEAIELPVEEDGTLLLSTLQAQFPETSGLKYRNSVSNTIRGIRLTEGRLHPPKQDGPKEDGLSAKFLKLKINEHAWGNLIYLCVFPKEISVAVKKRKRDDDSENTTAKRKRIECRLKCTDLIVLDLPLKTTNESLKEYFSSMDKLLMVQIKKDYRTGRSKGFGFIRFASFEGQMKALSSRHFIDGRWCDVKVPSSKEATIQHLPCKVFVGRCTKDITAADLKEYFSKFGEVTDVFIPKEFRAFSFVTFLDPEVAQSLCDEYHIVKGKSVFVSTAAPKSQHSKNYHQNNSGRRGSGNSNSHYSHRGSGGNLQNHDMYNQVGPSSSGSVRSNYKNTSPHHNNNNYLKSLGINPNGQNGPPNLAGMNMNTPIVALFYQNQHLLNNEY